MTNEEMMNKQISEIAELFKTGFTKEELVEMEKKYDEMMKKLNEENEKNS